MGKTIQIPTKKPLDHGNTSSQGQLPPNHQENGSGHMISSSNGNDYLSGMSGVAHRRQSSNSSLDLAASIFSSIQGFEMAGGCLSTLGLAGFGSGGSSMTRGQGNSAHNGFSGFVGNNNTNGGINTGVNAGVRNEASGYNSNNTGFGNLYHDQSFPVGNSIPLEDMLATAGLFGGNATLPPHHAGYWAAQAQVRAKVQADVHSRQFEGEELLLNQQLCGQKDDSSTKDQYRETNHAAPASLFSRPGGFVPSRRNSRDILEEIARGNSRDLLGELGGASRRNSRDLLQELEGLSRSNSRDILEELEGLSRCNSRDFLDGMSRRNSRDLLEEMSRRNSRDLLEEMSRRNSRDLLGEVSRRNSRDLADLFTGLSYSRDNNLGSNPSLTLLATANEEMKSASVESSPKASGSQVNAPDSLLNEQSSKRENNDGSRTEMMVAETAAAEAKPLKLKTDGAESNASAALASKENDTIVSGDNIGISNGGWDHLRNNDFIVKKRSNSSSSLDALLSVFGDELAELDREQNDDDKSTTSSLGFFNGLMVSAAAAADEKDCDRETNDNYVINGVNKKQDIEEGTRLPGPIERSSSDDNNPRKEKTPSQSNEKESKDLSEVISKNYAEQNKNTTLDVKRNSSETDDSYTSSIQVNANISMMAALESAMRQSEVTLEGMARHGLPSGRGGIPNVMTQSDKREIPNSMSPAGGLIAGSILPGESKSNNMGIREPKGFSENLIHRQKPSSISPSKLPSNEITKESPPSAGQPPTNHLLAISTRATQLSQSSLLHAIAESERSLAAIHAWDRSQGLRKCHSRTVVKTRRSREKIKAFLMGVDPPPEPTKSRKRTSTASGSSGDTTRSSPKAKKPKGPKKMMLHSALQQ